ncbi:hypothetical protein TRFO_41640 [Tritrichomonas foetus]|uniref:Uncharacterized protein n=1 Tax=Tritrichomonas foetus TaxID=1144522 RepID=A0A1J4KZJ8_9EUKA|nr:hypothetical protein TRFO_41640 [Tritrichomonas foetus]|eukprot:OHT16679.1 hypothetical protein TRFO_41640 [Tritrichomonas foetus]
MHSKISICKFSLLEKLNGNFALLYHYTKGSTIYFCSFFQNQVNTALFSYDSVHVCDIEMCKLFQNKGDMLRHVNVTKINIIDCIGDYPHKLVSCNDYIHGSNDYILCYNYDYRPNQQQNLTIPLEFDHLYCDHTKIETALRVYITNKHVSWVGFTLFFFVGIKTYLSLRKRRIEQAEENHRRVTQERMEEEALSITEGLEFEHEEEEEQNNNPGQNN